MTNPQVCLHLQKQAKFFEASWSSSESSADLWKLCLARDLLHFHCMQIYENFQSSDQIGLLSVQSDLLDGYETWFELPAEWASPDWFRVQRYNESECYLAWEWNLSALGSQSQIQFKLAFVLPAAAKIDLQSYFDRFCQTIEAELAHISQAAWPQHQHQEQWKDLIYLTEDTHWKNEILRQLALSGKLEPQRLQQKLMASNPEILDFLNKASHEQLILPYWYDLEPDQSIGLPRLSFQNPYQISRWQVEAPCSLDKIALSFIFDEPTTALQSWPLLSEQWGRYILWPGESKTLRFQNDGVWQIACDPELHQILMDDKGLTEAQVDLNNGSDKLKLQAGANIEFQNNGQHIQLLCLQANFEHSFTGKSLSTYQMALPYFAGLGTHHETLQTWLLYAQIPFSNMTQLWVQYLLQQYGGIDVSQENEFLLLFDNPAVLLKCAYHLFGHLLQQQAWNISALKPILVMGQGESILQLDEGRAQITSLVLSDMRARFAQAPVARLDIQRAWMELAPFRKSIDDHWQVLEFLDPQKQRRFQLLPLFKKSNS